MNEVKLYENVTLQESDGHLTLFAYMVNDSRFINVRDTTEERMEVTTVNSLVYEIYLFLRNFRRVKNHKMKMNIPLLPRL